MGTKLYFCGLCRPPRPTLRTSWGSMDPRLRTYALEVSFKVDSGRSRSFSHWIRSAKFSDGPSLAPHLRRPVWGPVWLVMVGCCHLRQFNLKGPTCKHFWKLLFPLNMQGLTYKLQYDKTVSKICLELAILKLSKQDRLYKKRPFH